MRSSGSHDVVFVVHAERGRRGAAPRGRYDLLVVENLSFAEVCRDFASHGRNTFPVDSPDLPADVVKILEYTAARAKAYRNVLQSHEVAKLKADMMRVPRRWVPDRVSVSAVRSR